MKQVLKNASRVLLAFAALLGAIGVNAAEWDCAHTTSSNEYTLGTNCQISGGDVEVTTALEITGNFTNLENLVEVLAADNNRHFTVSSGTLTIRYLKLLGGRAENGGSIQLQQNSAATLNVYNSVFTENRNDIVNGVVNKMGKAGLFTLYTMSLERQSPIP